MNKVLLLVLFVSGTANCFPQHRFNHFQQPPPGILEFGVDANGCTVGPSGKVCPSGPVQFTHGAQGVAKPNPIPPPRQHHHQHVPAHPVHHHHHHAQFTGLVGPSGVIGPSGLVGPSGPLAFGK